MSKTFRRAAMSTICMLIVAVMSLTGATYAWFTAGNSAKVDGIEMTVSAATGGIWVSTELDGDYVQHLRLDPTAWNLNAQGVKPVSTVGGTGADWAFFTAEVKGDSSNDIKTTATTLSSEGNTNNYIKQTLFLKNDGNEAITVNLGTAENQITNISQNSGEQNAPEGFKAGRLGISYQGVSAEPTFNAPTENGNVCTAGFGILATNGDSGTYKGVKTESSDFLDEAEGAHLDTVTPITAENFTIYIPAHAIVEVDVYIWMEGQDSDCINKNAESELKIELYFEKVDQNNG